MGQVGPRIGVGDDREGRRLKSYVARDALRWRREDRQKAYPPCGTPLVLSDQFPYAQIAQRAGRVAEGAQ